MLLANKLLSYVYTSLLLCTVVVQSDDNETEDTGANGFFSTGTEPTDRLRRTSQNELFCVEWVATP